MNMKLNLTDMALVLIDPQVDLLSPNGAAWDLFGEQVTKRDTIDHMVELRSAAEKAGVPVLYSRIEISADDYDSWSSRNGIQKLFGERRLLEKNRGAEFIEPLEPSSGTVLLTPRKGPSSIHSDMEKQLQKLGVKTIIIAGMVANLCVEAHVREATEAGYNAVVIGDAVATLSDEAHEATMANFDLLATAVVSTESMVASLNGRA